VIVIILLISAPLVNSSNYTFRRLYVVVIRDSLHYIYVPSRSNIELADFHAAVGLFPVISTKAKVLVGPLKKY
jgi:hypothetical protein